jgi:hypothetical protein
MESKSLAGEALRHFIHEYGRQQHLSFDGSIEQTGRKTEFMCNILKYAIKHKINFAKGVIWEVRTLPIWNCLPLKMSFARQNSPLQSRRRWVARPIHPIGLQR